MPRFQFDELMPPNEQDDRFPTEPSRGRASVIGRWLIVSIAVFAASFFFFGATGHEFLTIPLALVVVALSWLLSFAISSKD